jgi:hypothetical protein
MPVLRLRFCRGQGQFFAASPRRRALARQYLTRSVAFGYFLLGRSYPRLLSHCGTQGGIAELPSRPPVAKGEAELSLRSVRTLHDGKDPTATRLGLRFSSARPALANVAYVRLERVPPVIPPSLNTQLVPLAGFLVFTTVLNKMLAAVLGAAALLGSASAFPLNPADGKSLRRAFCAI